MIMSKDLPDRLEPRADRAAADKAVLARVMAEPCRDRTRPGMPRHRPRLSGRLIVVGALAAGVLAGGTAVAAVLLTPQRPTVFDQARCYSEPSNDFSAEFPGTSITMATGVGQSGTLDVPDEALGVCSAAWQQGLLVYGSPGALPKPGRSDNPVPPLAVCVLPSGEAAVFPGGSDTCSSLGLPPMAPNGSADGR
jgi:hypothetical protein